MSVKLCIIDVKLLLVYYGYFIYASVNVNILFFFLCDAIVLAYPLIICSVMTTLSTKNFNMASVNCISRVKCTVIMIESL